MNAPKPNNPQGLHWVHMSPIQREVYLERLKPAKVKVSFANLIKTSIKRLTQSSFKRDLQECAEMIEALK